MNQPLVIILAAMVVGFVALVGLDLLIKKLDVWLMQHDVPVALRRRLPTVKRLADDTIEVIEFGNTKWDTVPVLILWGYLVTSIIVLLPLLTQSQNPEALKTAMIYIIGLYVLIFLVIVWVRSRQTCYKIALTAGTIQKQIRTFGRSGKAITYDLRLPVEAHTDCQPKKVDLKDSRLRYTTCWISKSGRRKFMIIHKNDEEAKQFRADLMQHDCPVVDQLEESDNKI